MIFASVLGADVLYKWANFGVIPISSTTNIDDLNGGVYDGIGWSLNGSSVAGFILAIGSESYTNYRAQIALLYGSQTFNKMYHRVYNGSASGWSPWVEF